MKVCTACNTPKPRDDEHYFPDARYADGYRGPCRGCMAAGCKRWRERNRARYNELRRLAYGREKRRAMREVL
jgi:hypothetical protein